jgi:hypothetical protein
MSKLFAPLSLVCINLVPLVGVFLFGWNIDQLIFLYCLECLVAGLFDITGLILARKKYDRYKIISQPSGKDLVSQATSSKSNLILFFSITYLVLVVGLSKIIFREVIHMENIFKGNFNTAMATATIFLGYLGHFYSHYIVTGKYKVTDPADLFYPPFRRVIILFALMFISQTLFTKVIPGTTFYLGVLIMGKMCIDLGTYYYFRDKSTFVE